jgi:arylformamidase
MLDESKDLEKSRSFFSGRCRHASPMTGRAERPSTGQAGGVLSQSVDMHDTDIEFQFNPRHAVRNVEEHAARLQQRSAIARDRHQGLIDLRYGPGPLATLDVFRAEQAHAPVHVFLHGGYWRGRDKSDFSFLADALVPQGITLVVMNYDLCPQVELPAIVDQVAMGLNWVQQHATDWGADPSRYSASGHSAGAHLIAAVLARHAHAQSLPIGLPSSAVLISGVYDLEPVLSISVNQEIRLRPEQVAPLSPLRHLPCQPVRLDVVVGGAETPGFIEQSKQFAAHCAEHGAKARFMHIEDADHYTVLRQLESPEGELSRLIANGLVSH